MEKKLRQYEYFSYGASSWDHKLSIPKGVEDAIDRKLGKLFDQWRKLTDEILSELTERYEIGESVFFRKSNSVPIQVNSVK